MSSSKKVKLFDPKRLSPEEREFAESMLKYIQEGSGNSEQEVEFLNPPGSGLYGTGGSTIDINYNQSPNEKIISKGDAHITFGTDKPSGPASGKSRSGALRSARIDLVVGRMAGGASPAPGSYVGNSFQADAARIYISELTDIDKNFGVTEGKSGEMKDRSGIGIKADGVRIIGREGVKIVTGRMGGTGEKNSLGGKMLPAPTIELLAGNNSEPRRVPASIISGEQETYDPVQGVAMGDNTVRALGELSNLMTDVISILRKKSNASVIYSAAINIALQLPSRLQGAAAAAAFASYNVNVLKTNYSLWQFFIDKALWDINYLEPFGYRYIESRNVKTT
jgi:alpha-D-ribose 1-methylphosphonate 5-triphosphate synthase subunit PhnG